MSIHAGIFGPGLCGKTYGCKLLSRSHAKQGRKSIVCDPNGEDWGPHALVFKRCDEAFMAAVWKHRNCAIFIDEATMTIDRGVEFTDLFTRVRHVGHILHVIGHRATVLLPVQRDQFGKLILFRQSPGSAKIWAEEWAEPRMMEATELKKYEFLYCVKFGAADGSHVILKAKFPPP